MLGNKSYEMQKNARNI